MNATRQSFATEVDPHLLEGVRALAQAKRRTLAALVDEAFADLLSKHQQPRSHVVSACKASHARFIALYEKLRRERPSESPGSAWRP